MMFYSYYKLDKHIAIIISLFQNRRSMYMLTELVQYFIISEIYFYDTRIVPGHVIQDMIMVFNGKLSMTAIRVSLEDSLDSEHPCSRFMSIGPFVLKC